MMTRLWSVELCHVSASNNGYLFNMIKRKLEQSQLICILSSSKIIRCHKYLSLSRFFELLLFPLLQLLHHSLLHHLLSLLDSSEHLLFYLVLPLLKLLLDPDGHQLLDPLVGRGLNLPSLNLLLSAPGSFLPLDFSESLNLWLFFLLFPVPPPPSSVITRI